MSECYEAAAFLLRASSIPDIDLYLSDHLERIQFDELHKERLSSGEQVVVEAAQALYGGWALCSLGEAIRTLDAKHYAALVSAMVIRRRDVFLPNHAAVS